MWLLANFLCWARPCPADNRVWGVVHFSCSLLETDEEAVVWKLFHQRCLISTVYGEPQTKHNFANSAGSLGINISLSIADTPIITWKALFRKVCGLWGYERLQSCYRIETTSRARSEMQLTIRRCLPCCWRYWHKIELGRKNRNDIESIFRYSCGRCHQHSAEEARVV